MCGITAILLHPHPRSKSELIAVRRSFTQNLLFNEIRGRAATGIGLVRSDGSTIIHKLPIPAAEMVKTEKFHHILDEIDENTTLLLGHTRNPTKGDPSHNKNNHPIQAGPIFGIHNGHIENDDSLFGKFDLKRSAEVDSEIIFRLLEPHSPAKLNGTYLAAVRPYLELMTGKFSFLSIDTRAPTKLLVIKHREPLSAYYHPVWQTLIFSSRYLFLRKQYGRAAIFEVLPTDRLLLFDALQLHYRGPNPADSLSLTATY